MRTRKGLPEMPAAVAAVFKTYPAGIDGNLRRLRRIIFDTAAKMDGLGALEETLKWVSPLTFRRAAARSASIG
jgi:hypothetical protein